MGIPSRPLVTTVTSNDLAKDAQWQHHIYEQYAEDTYEAKLLDVQVTVTTEGAVNFDFQVYDVSNSEEIFLRENIKNEVYKMNVAIPIPKEDDYDIRITNNDDTEATFDVVYTISLHE